MHRPGLMVGAVLYHNTMLFRALRHRNFRLFFTGQGLSLVGTWMQRIAMGWLVYRLTDSALVLGMIGFASQVPSFLVAPFAGVIADRVDRHRLLFVTQVAAMLQALLLAMLVMSGQVQVWHLFALGVMLGVVNGFDMPVRQAFVSQMVDNRADLGNAIALNSTLVNGSRLIGPSLAGLLIALWGEGICFLLNGLSYLAVLYSLRVMRFPKGGDTKEMRADSLFRQLREGARYAGGFPPIRELLMLLAAFSLFGLPYLQLLPVFARDILNGGPEAMGWLMGATGVGALVGAWMLARRDTVIGLGSFIGRAALVFGFALSVFSFSTQFWLSLVMMPFIGFGQVAMFAAGNTLLQNLVDDDKRGRVMSFYSMTWMGFFPLGTLIMGALADQLGAGRAVFAGTIVFMVLGAFFLTRVPRLRAMALPVYHRNGVLPADAGAQS
jgi:MFS family permease